MVHLCLFLCTLLCTLGAGIAENDHQQLLSPRFLKPPSGGYVGLGERRALRCEAVGAPAPRLRLLKDDQPLTNWTSLRLVHVLSNIGLAQAGAYQCLANNTAGAVLSAKAKLQVAHLTPTEEVSETVHVSVRKGGHVILEPPVVDSVPQATAIWSRLDGTPLDSRKFATTQDNRLVILDATAQLEGQYQVELTNPHTGDTVFGPAVELSVDSSGGEYKAELAIVVPPADRQFNNLGNGYDSYLECIAAGSPLEQVQIVWLKDDRPLGELPHVLTHWNRTLTLLHLRPQHAGRYTCQASLLRQSDGSNDKSAAPIVAHANVTVSVLPSLSRKVDEETAVELGQQVQLPCAAEGHPPPEVHWLLDAHPLDMSNERFRLHDGGTLEIRALAMEDAGVYQCVAENELGEARAATWLHVKISPPTFLRAPENVTVLDGMDAQLSCSVVGAPLPNTSWTYSDVVPVHSEGRMQILESGTLVIASVVLADSGKYTCVRANSAGSASAEAYLTVLVRTQIVKPPVDTRVILGSTAELQCRISHDPSVPYQVTWFFEEKPLTASSRTHLAPDGTLKIDQARNTDIGTYTCVVTSPGGNDTRSAKLEVIELPHPPGHVKASVTDTLPKTVNVTWSPAFDGHSPITHYVLQMRALPTVTVDSLAPWTTALSNISAEATSVLVSQLKPSVSYQFRVSAVNGVGEGSPGGPTEPVSVPPEPPGGPPQNVVGAPRSATSVMLQWQPPLEGERNGRLLGYVVRFRLAGYSSSAWSTQNVSITRALLEDLIVWQNYAIEVAAFNEKGLGVFSPSILVRTLEGVPQAAPTAVRADAVNSTAVRVRWLPPDPQRVNGINQGYRVEAWLRGREVGVSPPDATALVAPNVGSPTTEHTAVITGLRKYRMYNITVLCFTSPGNGPRSKPVLATTKQDVPGPVKSLKFDNILDVSVRVLWTPPEESNGVLLGYTLRYWIKDDPGSAVLRNLTADETETTVKGLRPVTWYTIEVFAWTVVGAGPSIEASIKSGIPPVLPTAPRRLAVSNIGPFSVMLQFTPGFDGNTSITRWIVEAQTRRSEQWIPVHETSAPGARTLHVSPLVPFTEYRLRLVATNVVGPSPPSEPSQWFQTIQAPPAHPPRNVTVRAVNANALRVRWTPLPQVDWYGVPRGYNVSFRAKDEPDFKWTVVEDHNANSVVLDGLQAFTPYEVFMVAFNDVGASSASAISSEHTRESTPSAGPSQVTAKATSSTTVVVSWGPVPRAHRSGVLEGYRVVYQAARESAPMRKHIESNATFTTTLTELRKYTTYTVQVLAYTRVGDGALSLPPIAVTTFEDVPGPPSNVSFPDVTTTTARIIWDVPQEPNGEILGYKISFWRRPGSSLGSDAEDEETSENADRGRVSREVSAMDRTLKAFDLQPQSYYEFAVSARTQEGWGMEARALVLTTASREKPQAPSRPLVSPSQVQARHVTLSWTPGRDGFAPLRCYLLQQIENTGPWKELPQKLDPSTTTYTVAGLKPATRYLFRLRAVNDLGFSPWSEPSNETWTLPAAPQVAPTNVVVTPYTTTSITVVWKGLAEEEWNGDKRHPGYRVEACPVGASLQDCRVRSLDGLEGGPLTLEGLQRDRIYEVRVIAYNGQGDGPPTRPVSVYVGEAVPTGSPRQLKLDSPSSTEIVVSWAPPAESERNGELLGYKIFYKAEGDVEEAMEAVPATPTAYTITDLRRFTKYSVQLLAFNPAGDGPRSKPLQVHTQADRPGPPGPLVFTDITMNSLNVSWTPPKEPNGIITGYLVNYETADLDIESGRQVRQKVGHTFLAVRGLDEMTTYRFTVRAETSHGYGAESQKNVTTGPQEGSPLAPLELALQRSATAATLSWKEGPPGASAIKGYLVEARPVHAGEDEEWQTVAELEGSPRTSYEVSFQNLVPSTAYTLRLFARNRLGISPPAYAPEHVLTPNKLFLEYKQRLPFYREPWFLVVLAAASMVAIILVVAVLCVKSKTHQYKQEMQQSLRSDDQLSLNDQQAAGFGSPEPPTKRTMTRGSLRKPLPALRSPPRPSPASVTYSDEEDTKAYDDHCDSSSLTEKPSEMSSSESQGSDSEDDTKGDPHSFVNHYANVNDTLRQSWKRQRIAKPPSYTDSEQESSAAMCLNGGRVVLNNMAGSRAPLPGFSSFV